MKKILIFIMLICCVNFIPTYVFADDVDLIPNASSGLLMEVDSGRVLFQKECRYIYILLFGI